ncbi:MAG: hypothetical protein M3Y53_03785 [Thermoproteota archaeon]|nr:hypothetical protein [Thermoproteota archaeon]
MILNSKVLHHNDNNDRIENRLEPRHMRIMLSIIMSIIILSAFMYVNSEIWNNKIAGATPGNVTHPVNPNGTATTILANTSSSTLLGLFTSC